MATRNLGMLIQSVAASDGAGVRLRRSLGQRQNLRLDPFLMLDEFGTDNPDDYIAGFPAHPHRGFETVTYMIEGHMQHEDHLGNRGDLTTGGVQWMTAGRGIIHSEMPKQTAGRMRGFQLWINLPAKEKMKPAAYRDIQPGEIPTKTFDNGIQAKIIAGTITMAQESLAGPIQGLSTEPLFIDLNMPPHATITLPVQATHNAFIYPFEGRVRTGEENSSREVPAHCAGVLSSGDQITLFAGDEPARLIVLAGRPLHESISQYGPFVMNTPDEIQQAIQDYQRGTLTDTAITAKI